MMDVIWGPLKNGAPKQISILPMGKRLLWFDVTNYVIIDLSKYFSFSRKELSMTRLLLDLNSSLDLKGSVRLDENSCFYVSPFTVLVHLEQKFGSTDSIRELKKIFSERSPEELSLCSNPGKYF